MHALKYFVVPSLAVIVWAALVVGTLSSFEAFAVATARPAEPASSTQLAAPTLAASR